MSKKSLIIIPNYNRVDLLKNCILSLEKEDVNLFDVLVIDNGSKDESKQFCIDYKNTHTNFYYIFLENNEGFAKATNRGFEYSINNNYKYSILLNNDTEVEKDFVKSLIIAIEKNEKTFSVSSLMVDYYNRDLCDDTGDAYNLFAYQFQINKALPIKKIKNYFEVFSSCGGASIFSNDILKIVGFLDEFHFAYLEDIDLGYRAKLYGYKNYFTKEAVCYHIGSATSGSKYNDFKVRLSARNSILVLYKNMPLLMCLINLPFLLIGFLLKQLYFNKKGFAKVYRDGLIEGFHSFNKVKKVDFLRINILQYVKIEIELIYWSIIYIWQFIQRKLIYKY